MARTGYLSVPPGGTDPRTTAQVIRRLVDGKTNNVGDITIARSAGSPVTVQDVRVNPFSFISLMPLNEDAIQSRFYIGNVQNGQFDIFWTEDFVAFAIASTTAGTAFGLTTTFQDVPIQNLDAADNITLAANEFTVLVDGDYVTGTLNALWSGVGSNNTIEVRPVVNGVPTGEVLSIPTSNQTPNLTLAISFFQELDAGDTFKVQARCVSGSMGSVVIENQRIDMENKSGVDEIWTQADFRYVVIG